MKKLLLLLSLCMAAVQLFAQSRTVTGTVTDNSGAAVVGASVQVKGGSAGTVTSSAGTFSLNVPASARTLVISSVNFATQEVSITSGPISVRLSPGVAANLEEVVVTGYQTVRKKDVTAAISRISAADIENLPVANFAQSMQGRAAGVAVSASNGIPGGNLSVIIRGVGSINAGTTPLYIVDGVQLNTGSISTTGASVNGSINTQNNPLNFLNPDDIESIEILKDAAAASIYGARAANGVVLVTTKKGKAGKTRFTFNTMHGQASPLKMMDVLNSQEYYKLRSEAVKYANPTFTDAQIDATVRSNIGIGTADKVDSLPTYDWQDVAFGVGKISNYELSMQGGSEALQFYVSGSYAKQEAFIKPTDLQRAALLSKLTYKISKKFSFENSLSVSTFSQNAPYSTGNTGFGNPAYAAPMMLPTNPIYNADGTFYGMPGSGQSIVGSFNHNIIAIGEFVRYRARTNQVVGSAALTYNPNADLTLKTFVGLDYRVVMDHRYQDPRVNDAFSVSGRLSNQVDWNTNIITNTTAAYRKTFNGKHNVNALLGLEFRKDVNEWFQADGQGFPSFLLQYMSSAATPVGVSGSWGASATFSQFGKLGYSYLSRYIFNYTVRRDGSSRFGNNNKFGMFHSAQFAWNAKEESFLKNVNAISDLKLRYSYGQAGNDQINNFLFRQLYGAARIYGNNSAINPTQLGNPDLSWELREEHNIGLDLGLFNNRVSLTVDAYRKVNSDLLLARPLYLTTGFSSIQQNLGSMENKGLEILLAGTPFKGAFTWNTSFNIAFQKNKVLSLYDGLQELPSDRSIAVGIPYGSHLLARWAGVNPASGRGMWYDANDNITYNPLTADRKIIGDVYPDFFGGWNNTFSYKNFSVDAFFQYEYGRVRLDGQYQQMMRMGGALVNQLQEGYDGRWQKPGDYVATPRPFNGLADFNSVGWGNGSRYYFKTDYIRLKQLTLAYDLTKAVSNKLGLENARFYVQGMNLWTTTKWRGYDPEFTGENQGIIPQSKSITVGLQVKF
jgi:TonB-linked SusC/RagA family outer membrane protein